MDHPTNYFRVLEFPELDSTSGEVWRQIDTLHDRTVIVTPRQTGGRGHGGNSWESAPGENVTMTLLLKPPRVMAARQFAISMLVALATRDLVARHVEGCTVKWPNDIYVGDRKIAGILIEHVVCGPWIARSLCGIGLNVNQERFLSDAPNPVSLRQLTGREWAPRQVLEELLECLRARLDAPRDRPATRHEYRAALYRGTGRHAWRDASGEFHASVSAINPYGQLVLRDDEGSTRVYGFKEVAHVL
jgi:BirA family biotin operon repressor/biotin-[acetyl-CoA-carboxylase] ligase